MKTLSTILLVLVLGAVVQAQQAKKAPIVLGEFDASVAAKARSDAALLRGPIPESAIAKVFKELSKTFTATTIRAKQELLQKEILDKFCEEYRGRPFTLRAAISEVRHNPHNYAVYLKQPRWAKENDLKVGVSQSVKNIPSELRPYQPGSTLVEMQLSESDVLRLGEESILIVTGTLCGYAAPFHHFSSGDSTTVLSANKFAARTSDVQRFYISAPRHDRTSDAMWLGQHEIYFGNLNLKIEQRK
jgi:hypothetical protein